MWSNDQVAHTFYMVTWLDWLQKVGAKWKICVERAHGLLYASRRCRIATRRKVGRPEKQPLWGVVQSEADIDLPQAISREKHPPAPLT